MRTRKGNAPPGFAALTVLALCVAGPLAAQQGDPRADLFVRNTCTQCHAVSALGLRAAADVGPDLTFAYADVLNRYGTTLEYFLGHPAGVMRMILQSHVELTPAARDSIVQVLKELFEQRRAEMDDEIPSTPPGRFKALVPLAPRSNPHLNLSQTYELPRYPMPAAGRTSPGPIGTHRRLQ